MKGVFVSDEHHPYQDEGARKVALEIVRNFAPDLIITGSDGLDFYSLSSFDKNPDRLKTGLQEEIDSWKAAMREWKSAAPRAKLRWIIGNHEDRLRRYMWRNPQLYEISALSLPNLLGLSEFGITDDGSEIQIHNLVIRHGSIVRRGSGQSVRAEIERERYAVSVLSGHTHRGGSVLFTTRNGIIQGQEAFCLCKTEAEYVDRPDWQQGIVLFEVDERGLTFEPVPIMKFRCRNRAVWREKEYIS